MTNDPICGKELAAATAFRAERDGKTAHFCSKRCRENPLSGPAGEKSEEHGKDSIE